MSRGRGGDLDLPNIEWYFPYSKLLADISHAGVGFIAYP